MQVTECRRQGNYEGRALFSVIEFPAMPLCPTATRRPDGAERSALSHGWRQTTGRVTYTRLYGIAPEIHYLNTKRPHNCPAAGTGLTLHKKRPQRRFSHLLLWSYGIVFISPIDSTLNVAYTFCGSRSTCYFLNILTTSSGTLLPGIAFFSRYFAYPLRSKIRLSCFLYGSTLSIKSSITFCFSLNDIVCPLI